MNATATGSNESIRNQAGLEDNYLTNNMKAIKDLVGLARFILSPECESVVVLTGAGVSVASGMWVYLGFLAVLHFLHMLSYVSWYQFLISTHRPDFRSPGGMYDTLKPELITATEEQRRLMKMDPTYVVEKGMFMQNSFPYLEVRRPFILGVRDRKWKPTIGRCCNILSMHSIHISYNLPTASFSLLLTIS